MRYLTGDYFIGALCIAAPTGAFIGWLFCKLFVKG